MTFYYPRVLLLVLLSLGRLAQAQVADPTFRVNVLRYGNLASAATLPSGHVVVLGDQLYTNGTLTGSLVRFLPTGEFDEQFFRQASPVDCGLVDVSGPYRPLVRAYPDGRLLLVGNLTTPQLSGPALRLLPSGQVDPNFGVPAGTLLPSIRTAALQPDGKVLLAGTANRYSGAPCLLRLLADGSLDPTFAAPLGNAATDYVQALAVQPDGRILVAGHFTQPATGLVRLLPNGQLDPSFQPAVGAGGIVEEVLCRPDGRVLVGGRSSLVVQGRPGALHQLLADGQLDPAFDLTAAAAYNLVRNGDNRRLHLLRGGRLCLLPLAPAPAAVFLLPNGQPDPARPALTSWPLSTLTAATPDSAGQLLVSGQYRHRGGAPGNLVRLLASGQRDATYAPQLCQLGGVSRLVEQPGLGVVLAGSFDLVNGTPSPNLARLLPGSAQVDTAFSRRIPRLGPLDVVALHVPDTYLLASGFHSVNERSWSGVIRLYPDGRLDTLFRRWPGGYATPSLAVQANGRVLVAGALGYALASQGVARLLPNGDHDPSFVLSQSTSLGTSVRLLAQPDGRLLLLGSSLAVRVQPDGRYDPTFTPTVLRQASSVLIEDAVLQPDGRITLCGQMPPYTNTFNTVLRLLPDGRRDTTLAAIYTLPGLRARTLCYQPDGRLLVGGSTYNPALALGIGLRQYLPDGTPDPAFTEPAGVGAVQSLLRTSTGRVLVGGAFLQADSYKSQHFSLLALTSAAPLATVPAPAASLVEVYPNPARHQVRVRLAAGRPPRQVRLLDALGRVLLTQALAPALVDLTLDTAALPRGSYLLRIDYAQGGASTCHLALE